MWRVFRWRWRRRCPLLRMRVETCHLTISMVKTSVILGTWYSTWSTVAINTIDLSEAQLQTTTLSRNSGATLHTPTTWTMGFWSPYTIVHPNLLMSAAEGWFLSADLHIVTCKCTRSMWASKSWSVGRNVFSFGVFFFPANSLYLSLLMFIVVVFSDPRKDRRNSGRQQIDLSFRLTFH